MADLKQIWRNLNEMLQHNKIKVVHKGDDNISAMQQVKDMLHRIEITWVKLEKYGMRMEKSFSTLTRESNYDSNRSNSSKRP